MMHTLLYAGQETVEFCVRLVTKLAATLRAMQGLVTSDAQRLQLLEQMVKQGVYT